MRIGIAADHGGFSLKEQLFSQLREAGHEVVDFGAHHLSKDDDYPDDVLQLAQGRGRGEGESWRSDLREWRRRVGLRKQNARHPGCINSRPFFCEAGRRGRPHEHSLHGWQDGRTRRCQGSRSDVSRSQFSQAQRHLRRLSKVASLETEKE